MIFQLLYRADDFLTDRVFQPLVVRFHVRNPAGLRVFFGAVIVANAVTLAGWSWFHSTPDPFPWIQASLLLAGGFMVLAVTWSECRKSSGKDPWPDAERPHHKGSVLYRLSLFVCIAAFLSISLFSEKVAIGLCTVLTSFCLLASEYFEDCRPFAAPLDPSPLPPSITKGRPYP